jgi:hypothetical protein
MTEEEAAISYNITNRVKQRGTSAEYYTARIARDRPDILEEMKAGKYKSVRAADRHQSGRCSRRCRLETLSARPL